MLVLPAVPVVTTFSLADSFPVGETLRAEPLRSNVGLIANGADVADEDAASRPDDYKCPANVSQMYGVVAIG